MSLFNSKTTTPESAPEVTPEPAAAPAATEPVSPTPPNRAGEPWLEREDRWLAKSFHEDRTSDYMAERTQRTRGAIHSRLHRLLELGASGLAEVKTLKAELAQEKRRTRKLLAALQAVSLEPVADDLIV